MLPHPDSIRIITPIIAIGFLFLGLKRPVFPVLGFMYFYYWSIAYFFPFFVAMKAELLYGVLVIGIVLFSYPATAKNLKNDPIVKYFYWFLGAYVISFAFAWDHAYSWVSVYHFIKVLIITFGVLSTVKDDADIKIVIWGIVLMYVYLSYEPMYRFLTQTEAKEQMYGDVYVSDVGILSGHVSLANNMNQMIPIATFLIFTVKNKLLRIFSSIPLLIFLLCLVGSKSRGGIVGFIFFLLLILIFARNLLRSGFAVTIIVTICFTFGSVIMGTFSRIDTSSTEGRLIRIIHGIEMVRKGNILGVGPGCYTMASGRYFGHTMESHSLYGQLVGELGIPGTITWFLFIKALLIRLNRIRKESLVNLTTENNLWYYLAIALLLSLIVRLFVGLGSHSLYFFNWYVFGMLAVHISRFHEEMKNEATVRDPL